MFSAITPLGLIPKPLESDFGLSELHFSWILLLISQSFQRTYTDEKSNILNKMDERIKANQLNLLQINEDHLLIELLHFHQIGSLFHP